MVEKENDMPSPSPKASKYRLPSEAQVMKITPDIAADWLENRNTKLRQRSVSEVTAIRYAGVMKKPGAWKLTHQGIAFDTEGWLLDGQTRLRAVQISGCTVEFRVFPNEPRDVFDVLDLHRKRQAAQLLHAPYASIITGSVRFLAVADGRWPAKGSREARADALSVADILKLVNEYGPPLEECAAQAAKIGRVAGLPASSHAALLYQALHSPHADRVPDWSDALFTGAIGDKEDARLRLRSAFTGYQRAQAVRTRTSGYALMVKAWNRYVNKLPTKNLMWRGDEAVPTVEGFVPNGTLLQ